MENQEVSYICSGSHKHVRKYVKINRSAGTSQGGRTALAGRKRLSVRNPRKSLQITIQFVGGGEGWWKVSWGGLQWYLPSCMCLGDALFQLNGHRGITDE